MEKVVSVQTVVKYCERMLGSVLHAKQVQSVGMAVYAAMLSERLSSATLGRRLAASTARCPKHAIKQVDRLVGNEKVDVGACQAQYVRWVVGARERVVVSLDWTEYARDKQQRISLNLVTKHGRATPLLSRTYSSTRLRHHRGHYERDVLQALHTILGPRGVKVTVLADRGFADQKLYAFIHGVLGWDFVIRFRGNMWIRTADGRQCKARQLVPCNGRALRLEDACLTASDPHHWDIVLVKKHGMKAAWNLVSSLRCDTEGIIKLYGRRFTCEEQYRDEKDERFGFGSKQTRVSTVQRRDRWVLVHALATLLLTLLGAAGEAIGYDRKLRANTVKGRTHSLLWQGREYMRGLATRYRVAMETVFLDLLNTVTTTRQSYAIL